MKKSEEIRRDTRRMIAKNLIVLAALAIAASVGVVSWFTQGGTSGTADGISVETHVDDGLEFYVMPPSDNDQYAAINTRLADNATYNSQHPGETPRRTTWHTGEGNVTFNYSDQEFKFMKGLFLCDVTGDGITGNNHYFKIPMLMQYDDIAYIDTTQNFENATPNEEYMSFDLYFRIQGNNERSVALRSDSAITPNTTYEAGTTHEPADTMKDAAIGAVRMAVLNMNSNSAREVLWIPGPYVYYDGLNDNLYTGLTSSQYANKGAVYYTGSGMALRSGEGTNDHAYYADRNDRQVIRSNAANMFVGRELGSDKTVLTLNSVDNNGYRYGHIRVNLWIEGEDAESRLIFVGGKFLLSMHFDLVQN